MRIVLDTDVASGLIKHTLAPTMLAKIAPHEAALSFVTVAELIRWIHARDLGLRRRVEVEAFIATRAMLPGGRDVATRWGKIIAYADKRGRPRTTAAGQRLLDRGLLPCLRPATRHLERRTLRRLRRARGSPAHHALTQC